VLVQVDYPVVNADRGDVSLNPYDPTRLNRVLPYNELGLHRWGDHPWKLQGGTGMYEYEPTAPIAAYWKLRYLDLIKPPSVPTPLSP
jgi:hypothetical protein